MIELQIFITKCVNKISFLSELRSSPESLLVKGKLQIEYSHQAHMIILYCCIVPKKGTIFATAAWISKS